MAENRKLVEETFKETFPGNLYGNFRKLVSSNFLRIYAISTKDGGNFLTDLQKFPHPPFRGRKQETF